MKNIINVIIVAAIIMFASCKENTVSDINNSDKPVKIQNGYDSISYAIGASLGFEIRNQGMEEINNDAFIKGFYDAFKSKGTIISDDDAYNMKMVYFKKLRYKLIEKNQIDGDKFLAENKTKEGIKVTESGLQYEIIIEGNGPIPTATDKVRVHYIGTSISGDVFDSSVERGKPVVFSVKGVIAGWSEALQLMPVGSKWKLYLPSDLGYGTNTRPGDVVQPNQVILFEVELLDIVK